MYDNLFESMKIGKMKVKNRLVVPAMSTLTATPEGACTEQFVKYIERKAEGVNWFKSQGQNVDSPC